MTHIIAPAKLTLSLKVTGVREDGFHLIDAEMVSLELHDVLTITEGESGMSVSGPFASGVPTDDNNLVNRALQLCGKTAHVHIEKNIPHGSKIILKRSVSDLSIITFALSESMESASDGSDMKWISIHTAIHENSFISILSDLTDIQIETLRLVAQGLSNSEIARVRYVSEKSVEQIVARIAQHLEISPDRSRNLRVILAGEYFKWLGAPRH